MILALLQDLNNALDAMPSANTSYVAIREITRAVRRVAPRIIEYPWCFFGILYADLVSRHGADASDQLHQLLTAWESDQGKPWLRCIHVPLSSGANQTPDWVFHIESSGQDVALAYAPEEDILLAVTAEKKTLLWKLTSGKILHCDFVVPDTRQETIRQTQTRDDKELTWFGSILLLPETFCVTLNNKQIYFEGKKGTSGIDALSIGNDFHIEIDIRGRSIEIVKPFYCGWRPHDLSITSLIQLGPGTRFATASKSGEIAVWDAAKLVKSNAPSIEGHSTRVRSIDLDYEGRRCISLDLNSECIVWNLDEACLVHKSALGRYSEIGPFLEYLPSQNQALVQCKKFVQMLDISTGRTKDIAWHPISENPRVLEKDFQTWLIPLCASKYTGYVLGKYWGRKFDCWIVDISSYLEQFGRNDFQEAQEIYQIVDHSLPWGIDIAAFSAHSALLAVDCYKGVAMLFDLRAENHWGEIVWQQQMDSMRWLCVDNAYTGHFGLELNICTSLPCALSMNAHQGIIGDSQGKIAFVDFASVAPSVRTVVGHTGPVTNCSISADGQYAMSVGIDKAVMLWDCQAALPLASHVLEHTPSCCKLSENGGVLAVGCLGGGVAFFAVDNIDGGHRIPPAQLRLQEEEVLSRLRERDGVLHSDDINHLFELIESAGTPIHIRVAAADRLKSLTTTAEASTLDEDQRREIYAKLIGLIGDEDCLHLRSIAIGAIHDPSLLKCFVEDRDQRVAHGAQRRLTWVTAGLSCPLKQGNGETTATVTVGVETGLDAILANVVGRETIRFGHAVTLRRPDVAASDATDATDMMAVLVLAAGQGTKLVIRAEGDDAHARRFVLNLCGLLESPDVNNLWLDRHLVEDHK
jgi:WD40 repeat protein/phosphotransferase system HPr-like phosphotransfer protein